MKILFYLLLFGTIGLKAQTREIWMLGPTLHFNIGGDKVRASWGVELSYWNYQSFPYSVDFGIEFEKRKLRLYTEAQTGLGFVGIAAGPVFEANFEEKKVHLGFQSSLWINYFLGANFRYRKINGKSYFAPGTYFKLPVGYDRPDGSSNNSSGGKSELLDAIF